MPRVYFPHFTMTLVKRASDKLPPNNYVFRVSPKMTKTEVRAYLQGIYNVPVQRVATVNYDGKMRRSGAHVYRMKDYKKVYVRIGTPKTA